MQTLSVRVLRIFSDYSGYERITPWVNPLGGSPKGFSLPTILSWKHDINSTLFVVITYELVLAIFQTKSKQCEK